MINESILKEVTMDELVRTYGESHIDNDILLIDDLAEAPLPQEPCRMGCLLFALCTGGSARYFVDTVERTVQPGDLIIIEERQVTHDCVMSPDCRGIIMAVSADFFQEAVKNVHDLSALFLFARTHPVCRLSDYEVDSIRGYFAMIKAKIADTAHRFRRETVLSMFTTMVYDLFNAIFRIQRSYGPCRTRAEKIFTDFIRLVEQNFRNERRVGWYAQEICISPKYLAETVKSISHRTPTEWIDNYVTLEMRVQLKNSTKSIKEIARGLNFSTQSFLGKYFKEHVGMSPSEYRKA